MSENPLYRGASLMRNTHPHRTTTGPQAQAYGRVLRFLFIYMSE